MDAFALRSVPSTVGLTTAAVGVTPLSASEAATASAITSMALAVVPVAVRMPLVAASVVRMEAFSATITALDSSVLRCASRNGASSANSSVNLTVVAIFFRLTSTAVIARPASGLAAPSATTAAVAVPNW